jgi:chromosome segregation ATPase
MTQGNEFGSSDRIGTIEAILARIAVSQEQLQQRQEQFQQGQEQLQQRQEQFQQGQEQLQQRQEQFQLDLGRTEAVVDSNARAIEANSSAMAEMRQSLRESLAASDERLRINIEDTFDMIRSLAANSELDRQETDQRIQTLIEEGRAQRREIQVLVDEGRVNRREHQAFREASTQMFGEIQRLWQRLAS